MQNYGAYQNYYQQSGQTAPAAPAPAQPEDRELGWEEEFSGASDWVLLPEGDYPFRVETLTRKRFNGADWLPACNTAELSIRIFGEQEITLRHTLYLHTRRLYAMKHFFVSIGQAQEGDDVIRPRWQEVPGAEGMCHVIQRDYDKKDGTTGKANRIQKFLPPAQTGAAGGAFPPAGTPQSAAPAPAPAPEAGSWQQQGGSWQQQSVTGFPQTRAGNWASRGF